MKTTEEEHDKINSNSIGVEENDENISINFGFISIDDNNNLLSIFLPFFVSLVVLVIFHYASRNSDSLFFHHHQREKQEKKKKKVTMVTQSSSVAAGATSETARVLLRERHRNRSNNSNNDGSPVTPTPRRRQRSLSLPRRLSTTSTTTIPASHHHYYRYPQQHRVNHSPSPSRHSSYIITRSRSVDSLLLLVGETSASGRNSNPSSSRSRISSIGSSLYSSSTTVTPPSNFFHHYYSSSLPEIFAYERAVLAQERQRSRLRVMDLLHNNNNNNNHNNAFAFGVDGGPPVRAAAAAAAGPPAPHFAWRGPHQPQPPRPAGGAGGAGLGQHHQQQQQQPERPPAPAAVAAAAQALAAARDRHAVAGQEQQQPHPQRILPPPPPPPPAGGGVAAAAAAAEAQAAVAEARERIQRQLQQRDRRNQLHHHQRDHIQQQHHLEQELIRLHHLMAAQQRVPHPFHQVPPALGQPPQAPGAGAGAVARPAPRPPPPQADPPFLQAMPPPPPPFLIPRSFGRRGHYHHHPFLYRATPFVPSAGTNSSSSHTNQSNNNNIILAELLKTLRPIAMNDPTCSSYTYESTSDEIRMQQINKALRQNTTLRQMQFHPTDWKDLKLIRELATIIANHPRLQEVHVHCTNDITTNFITPLAVEILLQSFKKSATITTWCLHFASSSSTGTTSTSAATGSCIISDTFQQCISTAPHLKILELYDLDYEERHGQREHYTSFYSSSSSSSNNSSSRNRNNKNNQNTTPTKKKKKNINYIRLADAIASSSNIQILKLVRLDQCALQCIFEACAVGGKIQKSNSSNFSCSGLRELYIESSKEAGTIGLRSWISSPTCRLQRLTLKSIQTFQRIHADRLIGALINQQQRKPTATATAPTTTATDEEDNRVKHVAFLDCCFHPEVVRPLQDLVKNRLDLESFQITRCNADPSMALLTVCANVYNGQMTKLRSLTMGFSLGIEDRLGGDAIRSVLRYNPHLKSLNLTGSHRLGALGFRHVARGLGKNTTLKTLDLSHCSITLPSLRLLIQHITSNTNSNLTHINLSHNSLGVQGAQVITKDWLLHPNCVLEELILNRCEIYSEAFMTLIRAIQRNASLQVLEVMECGRLSVNELQELAESLFRLGGLRSLKASCFKSPVQPIRPVPPHQAVNNNNNNNAAAGANDDFMNLFDNDDGDDDDDDENEEVNDSDSDEDEDDLELLLQDNEAALQGAAAAQQRRRLAHRTTNNNQNINYATNGSKLLKETFLAGVIHNQRLEHISLTNILECVMKPKDALRVRAWMDFCGKRNLMQPLLQQTEIPLLDILTDVVRQCRDPRTRSLSATGLSLHYYCLRNRPDALDRVQRMLTVEAERKEAALQVDKKKISVTVSGEKNIKAE